MPIDLRELDEGIENVFVEAHRSDRLVKLRPAPWPVSLEVAAPSQLNLELEGEEGRGFDECWRDVRISGQVGNSPPTVSVKLPNSWGTEMQGDQMEGSHPPMRLSVSRAQLGGLEGKYRPVVVYVEDAFVVGMDPPISVVAAQNTSLRGHVADLYVPAGGTATVRGDNSLRVKRLVLEGDLTLTGGSRRSPWQVHVVEVVGGGEDRSTVTLDAVALTLESVAGGEVAVAGTGAEAAIVVPSGKAVENLVLAMPLSLEMAPGAVVRDVRGEVSIKSVTHAHLEGLESEPLRLVSLTGNPSEQPFRLATMLNLQLDPTHASIPLVMALEDCHRFTPALPPMPDLATLSREEAADMASHYERLGDVARRRHAEGRYARRPPGAPTAFVKQRQLTAPSGLFSGSTEDWATASVGGLPCSPCWSSRSSRRSRIR